MIVAQQADDVADEGAAGVDVDVVPTTADEPSIPSPTPTTQPLPPLQELPSTSQREIISNMDADEDVTLKGVFIVAKEKLDEEVEELKKHLQIVPNDEDGVYTEATPLARKVPVVEYEI
nr:hypothetical protein [Tanacetum cinerariifolium]